MRSVQKRPSTLSIFEDHCICVLYELGHCQLPLLGIVHKVECLKKSEIFDTAGRGTKA